MKHNNNIYSFEYSIHDTHIFEIDLEKLADILIDKLGNDEEISIDVMLDDFGDNILYYLRLLGFKDESIDEFKEYDTEYLCNSICSPLYDIIEAKLNK